jgi:hypothetical protein
MLCRGYTKQGDPCGNPATANGYCHLHGGIRSRRAQRREFERRYGEMTPEQRAEHDSIKFWILAGIILFMLILALATGNEEGFVRWLSR